MIKVKTVNLFFTIIILVILMVGCFNSHHIDLIKENSSVVKTTISNEPSDTLLKNLLEKHPQYFGNILSPKHQPGIQIIYSQIDWGKKEKDKAKFTDHTFNLNADNYFYPASTVKLPVAILALQKLNELNIPGLNKNTTMMTEAAGTNLTAVANDPSAEDGRPAIAHYIKKILLVSDNDAFNRLYEFLGQEYINNSLHKMGYTDVQIIHRLSISLTEEENRNTNKVVFIDNDGKVVYTKEAEKSRLAYKDRNTKMGKGYMRGTELINEPFDFSRKNLLSLSDLHNIVRSIYFPEDVSKKQRFNLSKEDYEFLQLYMSMRPGESKAPLYDTATYRDNYVKMIFYGTEKTKPESGIRIFNKTGTAYGFLIESCYFADFKNNIDFMLSAVIYCNSDGIFNDDKYDYNTVGYPFLKNLGRIIYDYELKRERKYPPDLSKFQFRYDE